MAKHLKITGLVQGVGFRYALCGQARRHGVTGWVRNRRDGSVEAVIDGEPQAVEALIQWSHHGPDSARVEKVEISDASGSFEDFEQRRTE
jgi:acylphosphatase